MVQSIEPASPSIFGRHGPMHGTSASVLSVCEPSQSAAVDSGVERHERYANLVRDGTASDASVKRVIVVFRNPRAFRYEFPTDREKA